MEQPDHVHAVVMTGPDKVEYQRLPYPDHLKPGAVILKMEMSGICGTDKHAFDGDVTLYGETESEQDMVYPAVHGHENSGIVVEMNGEGSKIEYSGKQLKVGDRVTNCPNVICGQCWYCRRIHAYPFSTVPHRGPEQPVRSPGIRTYGIKLCSMLFRTGVSSGAFPPGHEVISFTGPRSWTVDTPFVRNIRVSG